MAESVIASQGVPEAVHRLHATGERAEHQRRVLEAEAKRVQRRITGVPEDSGRLARSVHGGAETLRVVDDEHYEIGTKVPYGRFVFGGTAYMDARPPQLPPDVAEGAAKAISRDLEQAR